MLDQGYYVRLKLRGIFLKDAHIVWLEQNTTTDDANILRTKKFIFLSDRCYVIFAQNWHEATCPTVFSPCSYTFYKWLIQALVVLKFSFWLNWHFKQASRTNDATFSNIPKCSCNGLGSVKAEEWWVFASAASALTLLNRSRGRSRLEEINQPLVEQGNQLSYIKTCRIYR